MEVTREGAVATITLRRPDADNRVSEAMAADLRGVASELAASEDIRVVILTGGGLVFSTGREAPANADEIDRLRVSAAIAALPMPVVAALNGDAADHGLELALAADLRLAAPEANFWFTPPTRGGLPFDGGTQRLPRLVGPGWAADMLLTGRKVTAAEALSFGLVNRVSGLGEELMELACQLAGEIAGGSPLGARYVKEAIGSGADMALGQALGLEADLNVILQSTADRAEGIASFLERRPPAFTGE